MNRNLVVPKRLYDELEHVAKANNVDVVDVLKEFIRLGLMAANPGNKLYIDLGDPQMTRVVLFEGQDGD